MSTFDPKHLRRLAEIGVVKYQPLAAPKEFGTKFDADDCFFGKYTKTQMRLLAEHLFRRNLVSRERLDEIQNENNWKALCALLSRYYSDASAIDIDATFNSLNCDYFRDISTQQLLSLAEWLQRDGFIDEKILLKDSSHENLCSLIVEAYKPLQTPQEEVQEETYTPITASSSYVAKRLDSLLTVGEPILMTDAERAALNEQKSLWPPARSLDQDASAMCREFFKQAEQEKVDRLAIEENENRITLLYEIASIFYNKDQLIDAVEGTAQKEAAAEGKTEKQEEEKIIQSATKEEKEAAYKITQEILSQYGAKVLSGEEGRELQRAARLCLLLQNPIIRRTMERAGKVAHLTDAKIDEIRAIEREVSKEYAKEQREARSRAKKAGKKVQEEEATLSSWLWNKARESLGSVSLNSWSGFLLKSMLLSGMLLKGVGATTPTTPLTAGELAVGSAQQIPSKTIEIPPILVSPAANVPARQGDVGKQLSNLSIERIAGGETAGYGATAQEGTLIIPGRAGETAAGQQFLQGIVDVIDAVQILKDAPLQKDSPISVDAQLDRIAKAASVNLCKNLIRGNWFSAVYSKTGEELQPDECRKSPFTFKNLNVGWNIINKNEYAGLEGVMKNWFVESFSQNYIQVVTLSGELYGLVQQDPGVAAEILGAFFPMLLTASNVPGSSISILDPKLANILKIPEEKLSLESRGKGNFFDANNYEHAEALCEQVYKNTFEAQKASRILIMLDGYATQQEGITKLTERCSQDIVDTQKFIDLCPKDVPPKDLPKECQYLLKRLDDRLGKKDPDDALTEAQFEKVLDDNSFCMSQPGATKEFCTDVSEKFKDAIKLERKMQTGRAANVTRDWSEAKGQQIKDYVDSIRRMIATTAYFWSDFVNFFSERSWLTEFLLKYGFTNVISFLAAAGVALGITYKNVSSRKGTTGPTAPREERREPPSASRSKSPSRDGRREQGEQEQTVSITKATTTTTTTPSASRSKSPSRTPKLSPVELERANDFDLYQQLSQAVPPSSYKQILRFWFTRGQEPGSVLVRSPSENFLLDSWEKYFNQHRYNDILSFLLQERREDVIDYLSGRQR